MEEEEEDAKANALANARREADGLEVKRGDVGAAGRGEDTGAGEPGWGPIGGRSGVVPASAQEIILRILHGQGQPVAKVAPSDETDAAISVSTVAGCSRCQRLVRSPTLESSSTVVTAESRHDLRHCDRRASGSVGASGRRAGTRPQAAGPGPQALEPRVCLLLLRSHIPGR